MYRIQIPSYQIKHNFKDGFPAVTTKKLYWKGVVGELLWFLRGDTNIKYLVDTGIKIWNKDAYNHYLKEPKLIGIPILSYNEWLKRLKSENWSQGINGDLGRVYGAQWRRFGKYSYDIENGYDTQVDQISNLIKGLKENPMGTRHIVTAWNPAELDDMALPPCHWSFEILVEPIPENTINYNFMHFGRTEQYQFTLKWHQRSVDTFLGLPFNIASYGLLAQIIGKMTNMIPKGIIGDLSNVHIYEPHLDAVKEQLSRDIDKYDKCELNCYLKDWSGDLNDILKISKIEDFKLDNYKSYPAIPAEMLAYNK